MVTHFDLERRASAGEAGAQFTLGADLLARADSFDMFARGAALVAAAARNGHAEAMFTLATLEAVGAGRPRNWVRAFDRLERAAELGSAEAGEQLRLLSSTGSAPIAAAADDKAMAWSSLRERISAEKLLQVPHPLALSEQPRLRVFERFAHPAECEWLISRMRPKLGPALVWDEASGSGKIDPVRSNSAVEVSISETDVVLALLRARISAAMRLPEFIFEVPQVMHYKVGQEFRTHHDYLDPQAPGPAADIARRGQRMGTFLIFLNEDFDGGETEFPKAGISYRGRTGDALFFANITPDGRPDPMSVHAGRPPTRGEKWIFSQWIRDRAPAGVAR